MAIMIPRKERPGNRFRGWWAWGLLLALASGVGATEDSRARAMRLYDEGRYAEARPLLAELDAAGAADGVLLYRLHYCQLQTNDPAARGTLQRARERLEQEVPTSPTLEAPFYLANAYSNIGRLSDAKRVAAEATARLESGDLPTPQTGIEFFRLGKLYADQGLVAPAVEWYTRAVEVFEDEESAAHGPYADWASRYLAEHAEPRLGAIHLARTLDPETASQADLDRLAVLQVRAGEFAAAAESWKAAERRDPANANRPRYCGKLAGMAAAIGELPQTAADGRPWAQLDGEELDRVMIDQAALVRGIIAEANQAEKIKKKQRRQMQAQIDEAKSLFVSAGLEFALRRLGIREKAFFGGYAPLIFRPGEWELPAAPD
jgi:tetratricopeptide (TPR) repeat protein